jgi:hypothetical protein
VCGGEGHHLEGSNGVCVGMDTVHVGIEARLLQTGLVSCGCGGSYGDALPAAMY